MPKRLIYAEDAIFALDALFVKQIKQFGYDSYEKADEKTRLVCDGILESIGCLLNMPSAQPDKRLEKIADLVEGTIDHFDRDDAMDLLYQIKEVLNER